MRRPDQGLPQGQCQGNQVAFSLIEILIVVAIIALISGLLVAAIPAVRANAKKSATHAIIAMAAQALDAQRAQTGGLASLAEHPLASSRYRSGFVRADGSSLANAGFSLLSESLQTWNAAQITIALGNKADQLLLATDHFSNPNAPAFYGASRQSMQVLGMPLPEITQGIRLAAKTGNTLPTMLSTTSNTMQVFGTLLMPGRRLNAREVPIDFVENATERARRGIPDNDPPSGIYATESSRYEAMRMAIERALGGDQVAQELRLLKGLIDTPDDLDTNLVMDSRLWTNSSLTSQKRIPLAISGIGTYRLRGAALYDAWGQEILISSDRQGNLRLESAGRDRFFAWNPGKDGIFSTTAYDTAPKGDDENGSLDNISIGSGVP